MFRFFLKFRCQYHHLFYQVWCQYRHLFYQVMIAQIKLGFWAMKYFYKTTNSKNPLFLFILVDLQQFVQDFLLRCQEFCKTNYMICKRSRKFNTENKEMGNYCNFKKQDLYFLFLRLLKLQQKLFYKGNKHKEMERILLI